jgi:transposase
MENDKPLASSTKAQVRCKPINRQQLLFRPVDVEKLIEPDHPARAIWELTGKADLTPFYADLEAVEGVAGRPPWDPQLLTSLWIYAYKEGINSAREITRLCTYHPAYQWLTGLQVINHHTLADFRTEHREALDELFIEILGVLSHEGLITLERVMQDGTKVKACASDKSFHRKATLEDHLRLAREQVKQMGDPESEEVSQRVAKARERALREKQERLKEALEVLDQMQAARTKASAKEGDKGKQKQVRVSSTDPQARVMLQAKGGYGPSYNTQISTDAKAKVIVAVGVSQSADDGGELIPAVERIEANLGEKPRQIVADGAYPTQDNIAAMAKEGIDLIGPMPERKKAGQDLLKRRGVSPEFYPQAFSYDSSTDRYSCPGSKVLVFETEEQQSGWVRRRYRARRSDCRACPFQGQCCPETQRGRSLVRMQPTPERVAFQAKMETAEAQQIYKQRAGVAEFPNAWIKDKIGLRQFRLRGLAKVTMEALWACLTYNVCQWIRLCWKPRRLAQA